MHLSIKTYISRLYYFLRTPSRHQYFKNINFLSTKREVFTEKYRTEDFFVQTDPVERGLYKKTKVRYFSVRTMPSKRG